MYLIFRNKSCCGNFEYEQKWKEKFIQFIDSLIKMGINNFTVSIPYIVELLNQNYTDLKITISTINRIDNIRLVYFWEQMNIKKIIFDNTINRDFKLLSEIRKSTNLELEIIVNEICLFNCPYRNYHFNLLSHNTLNYNNFKPRSFEKYVNYKCNNAFLSDFSEFFKSPWIRPEDIPVYIKKGINFFKIIGRECSLEYIIKILDAYINNYWKGNLCEIFPIQLVEKIKKKFEIENTPLFFVDNQKLKNFLKFFLENRCGMNCQQCSYCIETMNNALTFQNYNAIQYMKREIEKEILRCIKV